MPRTEKKRPKVYDGNRDKESEVAAVTNARVADIKFSYKIVKGHESSGNGRLTFERTSDNAYSERVPWVIDWTFPRRAQDVSNLTCITFHWIKQYDFLSVCHHRLARTSFFSGMNAVTIESFFKIRGRRRFTFVRLIVWFFLLQTN